MNAKHTVLALSLLALAGFGHAGQEHRGHGDQGPRAGQHQPRESFTEETVRKSADGKVSKRKTEQKVTDSGFTRKSSFTSPEGKTATHEVSASYDKDGKTYTKTVKGTDFEGKSWSREFRGERGAHDGQHAARRSHHRRGAHHQAHAEPAGEAVKADASRAGKAPARQTP